MTPLRVVMMGTGTFAEPTFEALIGGPHLVVGLVTQPDRATGQERGSTRQTGKGMKTIALEKNIPVLQPDSINTPEGVASLRTLTPDILVVAAYGQILKADVLDSAPRGGINVHASLLPKYRGAAPVAWAIARGEHRTGVTIIRMTTGLDAGDMLAQESLEISPEETAGELESRLAPVGAVLALRVLDQIASGTVHGTKQDPALVTKAPKLKKENGLILWDQPAEAVCRQVRAMQPWPTAYTFFQRPGKPPVRLLILRVETMPTVRRTPDRPPGSLFTLPEHHSGSLFVTTGLTGSQDRGCVRILELQPAGKKRMTAVEFLRGHPIHAGDHLGPEAS